MNVPHLDSLSHSAWNGKSVVTDHSSLAESTLFLITLEERVFTQTMHIPDAETTFLNLDQSLVTGGGTCRSPLGNQSRETGGSPIQATLTTGPEVLRGAQSVLARLVCVSHTFTRPFVLPDSSAGSFGWNSALSTPPDDARSTKSGCTGIVLRIAMPLDLHCPVAQGMWMWSSTNRPNAVLGDCEG